MMSPDSAKECSTATMPNPSLPRAGPRLRRADPIDRSQLFGRKFQLCQGSHVLLYLLHPTGTNQSGGHTRLAEHPGKRHLRERLASFLGNVTERTNLPHPMLIDVFRGEKTVGL